jgi:hypothetical protein
MALKNTYGHNVSSTHGSSVGGYQAIMFTPDPNEPESDLMTTMVGMTGAGGIGRMSAKV